MGILFLTPDRGTSRPHNVGRGTYCGTDMNGSPSPNSSQGPHSQIPHQKQCSLRQEAKKGLIPTIKNLKRQGLLRECPSPYNIPILRVRNVPNKWRLIQDLHLINEAVVPLHPVVLNPYTLLT
jgi:hypothetical protein